MAEHKRAQAKLDSQRLLRDADGAAVLPKFGAKVDQTHEDIPITPLNIPYFCRIFAARNRYGLRPCRRILSLSRAAINARGRLMKADAHVEVAVLAVLRRQMRRFTQRDIIGLLTLFADDPDVVTIGVGADDKRFGRSGIRAQAEHDWTHAGVTAGEVGWAQVSASGHEAWVAADLTLSLADEGQQWDVPARFTGVLENRGGRWLWVQQHLSLPNERVG
jgi:hypothetical protein